MRLADWNEALMLHVRSQAKPGSHFFLYVDRELLGRLSALDPPAALDDLCNAFRSHSGLRPFQRSATEALLWRQSGYDGPPPHIAALAMTVLAVTEDPLGGSHGIYRRQNLLLGLQPDAVEPPGYGTDVPTLWRCWNSWLDGRFAGLGLSTARELEPWRLQSWARSQGLVRYRDRLLIERFLLDQRLNTRTSTAKALAEWLGFRGHDGRQLLEKLDSPAAYQIIGVVLEDEQRRLAADGPRSQHQSTRALLTYDDWDGEVGAAIPLRDEWVGQTLRLGGGREETVTDEQPYLTLYLSLPPAEVLTNGLEVDLGTQTSVTVGGETVYVMQDEPAVAARLQARGHLNEQKPTHLLVADPHLQVIRRALAADGHTPEPSTSSVPGWLWLENLRLDDSAAVLRILQWPNQPRALPAGVQLSGGLPLAAGTYLAGGEPDAVADPALPFHFDGHTFDIDPQGRWRVADHYPAPGSHLVRSGSSETRFRTVSGLKQSAAGGPLARPLQPGVVSDAARQTPVPNAAGAVINGLPNPGPLVIRCPAGSECLALTTDGELHQVWPSTARWLPEAGLKPDAVDIGHALGEHLPNARIFLTRSSYGGRRKYAIIVPPSLPRSAVQPQITPRPELVSELVTSTSSWTWIGADGTSQARLLLQQAMRWRPELPRRPPANRPPAAVSPVAHITSKPTMGNPYDDILTWLSEQERSLTSVQRFADAWAWTCQRHRHVDMADQWRLALAQLGALGHIERDFSRQQVGATPPALIALPAARGLSLLVGARPAMLLERLDDTDDPDPLVAEAACCWTIHQRTALTRDLTRPAGPTAVFIEWDPASKVAVEAGLHELGVTLQGCTSDTLLDHYPTLAALVSSGQRLTASPAQAMHQLRPAGGGRWQWEPCASDQAPGLYRYQPPHRTVFAWRTRADQPLIEIDLASGQWLARRAAGKDDLLTSRSPGARLLLSAPPALPPLLARALTLRTGLPAHASRDDQGTRLTYSNVDPHIAAKVAARLQQRLQHRYGIEDQ